MPTVRRPRGVTIPYAVVGDGAGPRMVFAHSLAAAALHAAPIFAPMVKRGWTVVTLDQRGHGAATGPAEADLYTPQAMGDDLLAIMDDVGWDRAWLGGGSMGCAPALTAAAAAPDRVEGLALLAPAFGRAVNVGAPHFARIGAALATGGIEAGTAAWAEWVASKGMPPEAVEQHVSQLRLHDPAAMAVWLPAIGAWTVAAELDALRSFPGPVLAAAWTDDDLHPEALAAEIAGLAPRGRLRLLGADVVAGGPVALFDVLADELAGLVDAEVRR